MYLVSSNGVSLLMSLGMEQQTSVCKQFDIYGGKFIP